MEKFLQILDKILPLVGVIIGAAITPWVSSIIEKQRHKRLIKANLIKSLHIFHSYWKMDFSLANTIPFKMRESNDLSTNIGQTDAPEEKERLQRKFDVFERDLFRKSETHLRITERKMEVEADIESLLMQTLQYFGVTKYNKVEIELRFYLEESHEQKQLYKYLHMEIESFPNLLEQVLAQIKEKHAELEKKQKRIVSKVQDTL